MSNFLEDTNIKVMAVLAEGDPDSKKKDFDWHAASQGEQEARLKKMFGDTNWSKRGGHPDSKLKSIDDKLKQHGFKPLDQKSSHSPDGSNVAHAHMYIDDHGNVATLHQRYGATDSDNRFSFGVHAAKSPHAQQYNRHLQKPDNDNHKESDGNKLSGKDHKLIKDMVSGFMDNFASDVKDHKDAIDILHTVGRQHRGWGDKFADRMEDPAFVDAAEKALTSQLGGKQEPKKAAAPSALSAADSKSDDLKHHASADWSHLSPHQHTLVAGHHQDQAEFYAGHGDKIQAGKHKKIADLHTKKAHDKWFDKLSDDQKREYLAAHPRSKMKG